MDNRSQLMPPRLTSHAGAPRRVGVELEFASLSAEAGAREVQALFGGTLEQKDPHRFLIRDTALGDFSCELDLQLAHRPDDREADRTDPLDLLLREFQEPLRTFFGDVSSLIIPCEIICPPIPLEQLPKLEPLPDSLRRAGAADTRANPIYGFGAQLNVEIAEGGVDWIVAMLKAYLLMSDWLRAVMQIDLTRRVVAFTNPFPVAYTGHVVDPDYWPDRDRLIDDYLLYNPTRNRELDMLPLFSWFDRPKVDGATDDPRIKDRPAFHYRLPDANFGQPGWGLLLEWNRWCVVERLAEQRTLLDDMGRAYRANRERLIPENWAIRASEWLMTA
ncbi:MAG: amidoligase family protein [Kiloniellales bacterium]|nr:amidoligase family protein [Kiloniellales bacterium]